MRRQRNDKLERIWEEVVVAKSRFIPDIWMPGARYCCPHSPRIRALSSVFAPRIAGQGWRGTRAVGHELEKQRADARAGERK